MVEDVYVRTIRHLLRNTDHRKEGGLSFSAILFLGWGAQGAVEFRRVDRTLQKMRKAGEIVPSRLEGWRMVRHGR